MTQFLRVRADCCQLVIDCLYVQEVGIWNDASPPAKEALWHDAVLEGASLPDMLGLPGNQVSATVVLRDPENEVPAILLGVSEIVGLIDLREHDFRPVLDGNISRAIARTAVFNPDLGTVLLKLEVAALLHHQ